MNLHLPSERRLDRPDEMVDRILAEAIIAGQPHRSRRRLLVGVAVAAAITLTATAVGVDVGGPHQPQLAGSPSLSASPQPTGSVVPPTATMSPAVVRIGRTVTFPYLRVTVESAGQIQVNNKVSDEYVIRVTTCVRSVPQGSPGGLLRLRASSWTVASGAHDITIGDPLGTAVPLPTTYPQDGRYAVGQCVGGVIPFGVDPQVGVQRVRYRNAFGDEAYWDPSQAR